MGDKRKDERKYVGRTKPSKLLNLGRTGLRYRSGWKLMTIRELCTGQPILRSSKRKKGI